MVIKNRFNVVYRDAAMRRQGLNAPYLSIRTKLTKVYKLSATTEPLLCIGAVMASYFTKYEMD